MMNTGRLRGIIAERGTSQRQVAFALGISDKAFYQKMDKGVFKTDELEHMAKLLKIDEPWKELFCAGAEQ